MSVVDSKMIMRGDLIEAGHSSRMLQKASPFYLELALEFQILIITLLAIPELQSIDCVRIDNLMRYIPFLSILALLVDNVSPQDACATQLSTDIQISSRICMGSTCLDSNDFQNIKASLNCPLDYSLRLKGSSRTEYHYG